jgi:hypothetical protein
MSRRLPPLWPSLVLVSLLTLVVQLPGPHATAWHFFDEAAGLLMGSGPAGQTDGLRLYGDRPDLQFGPLSIVVAAPLTLFGATAGSWLAMIIASAAGLVALALLFDSVDSLRPGFKADAPPAVLLAAGATMVIAWGDVAVRTAHIDDAIAWLAVCAALRWCAAQQNGRGNPWAVTLALAVAAAAKPWAIIFAPLALLPLARSLPTNRAGIGRVVPVGIRRITPRGVGRVVLVGALAALTWLPFILAEPDTLDIGDFGIVNDPTSVLRALGITDPTTPSWARPAQLIGGAAIVGLLVLAKRWPAAVLAGVAWRLLLEPGANRYYTIGLVIGALMVELLARRDRIPWMTIAGALTLELTGLPDFPAVPGRTLRLTCVVLALLAACVSRLPRHASEGKAFLPHRPTRRYVG